MHTDPSSTAGNSLDQVPSSESLHVSHSSHVAGETLSEPNVDVEALDLESLDSRSSVKSTLACVGEWMFFFYLNVMFWNSKSAKIHFIQKWE